MTKIVIDRNRKQEIKQIVLDTLSYSNLLYLPIDIKKICKSYHNIRLIPFSVQMKHRSLSLTEVIQNCESNDACVDYYADFGKYVIYYNDVETSRVISSNRYRWSIAHELGHVRLNHHLIYNRTRIFKSELGSEDYDLLETEADYFAQLILVPHSALIAFNIENYRNIRYMCKISDPAAKKRFYEYSLWKRHVNSNDFYDKQIFNLFYSYIFKKECKNCGAGIIQRYGKFCPICGSKVLQWGDGEMKYSKIEAHPNGKLKICPTCKNEETEVDGSFCQICNLYLVNECQNDNCEGYEQVLPTNARYCPVCGNESLFLHNGILKRWNYYTDGFLNIPDSVDDETIFNVPDGVEQEGLPFY